jgi:hypothetical protein
MKSLYFVLGIFATAVVTPAAAQNYPWCAQYGGSAGGVMNCGFVSFDQCMATLSAWAASVTKIHNTEPPPSLHRRNEYQRSCKRIPN